MYLSKSVDFIAPHNFASTSLKLNK